MSLLRKSQHGNAWHKRRLSFREKPMRGSALLQAPGTPPPPPLPQRTRRPAPPWEATRNVPAAAERPAEGYRQLPSVTDLAEQVTQAIPAVTRRDPQAETAPRPVPAAAWPPPARPYSGVSAIYVGRVTYPDPGPGFDQRLYPAALRRIGGATGTSTGYETDAAWRLAIEAGAPS